MISVVYHGGRGHTCQVGLGLWDKGLSGNSGHSVVVLLFVKWLVWVGEDDIETERIGHTSKFIYLYSLHTRCTISFRC